MWLIHIWCYFDYLVLQHNVSGTKSKNRTSLDVGFGHDSGRGPHMFLCKCGSLSTTINTSHVLILGSSAAADTCISVSPAGSVLTPCQNKSDFFYTQNLKCFAILGVLPAVLQTFLLSLYSMGKVLLMPEKFLLQYCKRQLGKIG